MTGCIIVEMWQAVLCVELIVEPGSANGRNLVIAVKISPVCPVRKCTTALQPSRLTDARKRRIENAPRYIRLQKGSTRMRRRLLIKSTAHSFIPQVRCNRIRIESAPGGDFRVTSRNLAARINTESIDDASNTRIHAKLLM